MKNDKKVKRFLFLAISKGMLIAFLILILLAVPTVKIVVDNKDKLSQKFFGVKAEFQGVLTLWNIDTFEGGTVGKSYFLETVASKFEKKQKGALIKVENLSISQMQESLKAGILPDMVSFGTGLGKYFVNDLLPYDDTISKNILSSFLSAGIYDGKVLAVPLMTGTYTLISTTEKIQNAGKEYNKDLKELALELGYTKKFRKSEKQIYSLTFGQNEYSGAFDTFSREFSEQSLEVLISENIVDPKCKSQTPYNAYETFVKGEASVLLGSQRDVVRMENRKMAGKENDVIYYPLKEYTDLVQLFGICTKDIKKYKVCTSFTEFLISDQVQKTLCDVGMFSVNGKKYYTDGALKLLESVITEKTKVRNGF